MMTYNVSILKVSPLTQYVQHVLMQHQFPRVRVTFDNESIDLSKECKNDLANITDIASIDRFVNKYGTSYSKKSIRTEN